MFRAFGYLMAFNVEAIALIVGAWFAGNFLNEKYPASHDWYLLTFPVAVLGIGKSLYNVLKKIDKKPVLGQQNNEKK